jgi:hypothetical protein
MKGLEGGGSFGFLAKEKKIIDIFSNFWHFRARKVQKCHHVNFSDLVHIGVHR